jgi:hypothetical protein
MFDEAQSHELLMNLDAPLLSENGQINEFLTRADSVSSQPSQYASCAHGERLMDGQQPTSMGANGMSHLDFQSSSEDALNSSSSMSRERGNTYNTDSSAYVYSAGMNSDSYTRASQASISSAEPINLAHAVKSSEHQAILAVLQSTNSRTEAAEKLGISPRTLRYKLAQLRDRGMSVSLAE